MTTLKNLFPLLGLLTVSCLSQHAAAQASNTFMYSSAGCMPLTSGLTWQNSQWSASADGARVLCPVLFGKNDSHSYQSDILPKGSESSLSSQKLSCKLNGWTYWGGNDIAGSAECTLGRGDTLAGISVNAPGGTAAQRAYFLAHPSSACYVTHGTASIGSSGKITASGSNTVSVKCPMIQTNQSYPKTALFHFSKEGTADCVVHSIDLYSQKYSSSSVGSKSVNALSLSVTLPTKRNYLYAECLFKGTTFEGISY